MKVNCMQSILLVMAGALVAPAWAAADAELAAFKQAIRNKYDLKEKAFAEHDAETIVTQFYSEDVISIGEGESLIRGREQLRPLYVEVAEIHPGHVRIESFATRVNGDLGWDWADFHVTPEDQSVAPFTFKILFLWERRNGEWVCVGDIFVVDRPIQVAEPAAEQ